MIRVLGAKRIVVLLVLIAVNVLLAAMVYGFIMPEKVKMQMNLNGLTRAIGVVGRDISHLQIEFDQLEDQQALYEELEKDGFFRGQNRRQAQDLLERVQAESQVISAVASIRPGEVEDHEEAEKANYKILVSPINLDIESMDDVGVYRYLYLVEKVFPGHIMVNSIEMERNQNLNAAVLRAVALGESPALIKAHVELSWRTMIAESQIQGLSGN